MALSGGVPGLSKISLNPLQISSQCEGSIPGTLVLSPHPNCKVLFNFKYYKLINCNWNCCYNQKYTKVISTKFSPRFCQHNTRYMLYLWGIVLQCTWVLCCGVLCCMLRCTAHSHCNLYTPPHQTGRTPVDRITTIKYTKEFPNPWGPERIPRYAQRIADRTYWGPSYMLRHALSLYIPHSLKVSNNSYWPNVNIQGAQHINMTLTNYNIRVNHEQSVIASKTPKLHLPAPPHEPTHHVQAHSPTISQGTT